MWPAFDSCVTREPSFLFRFQSTTAQRKAMAMTATSLLLVVAVALVVATASAMNGKQPVFARNIKNNQHDAAFKRKSFKTTRVKAKKEASNALESNGENAKSKTVSKSQKIKSTLINVGILGLAIYLGILLAGFQDVVSKKFGTTEKRRKFLTTFFVIVVESLELPPRKQ